MNADVEALERIYNRVLSTSNDEVEEIARKLLPKLIPLANDAALQHVAQKCLDLVYRRICEIQGKVSVGALLPFACSTYLPTACDIALQFCCLAFPSVPDSTGDPHVLSALLHSLESFEPLSRQSNILCSFCLNFLEVLPSSTEPFPVARTVLGGYFLDICLIQGSLVKGSVGSVQPGLSDSRVQRLTSFRENWTYRDLHDLKLRIINSLQGNWLLPDHSLAIAIACSTDEDQEVAAQGQYKVNGAKTMFSLEAHVGEVLPMLLTLALSRPPSSPAEGLPTNLEIESNRTVLRESVRVALLHYVGKELHHYLLSYFNHITSLLLPFIQASDTTHDLNSSNPSRSLLGSSPRYHLALLVLLEKVLDRADFKDRAAVETILRFVRYSLAPYASQITSATLQRDSVGVESSEQAIRNKCYRILQSTVAIVTTPVELAVLLFVLMEKEVGEAADSLHLALAAFRQNLLRGEDIRVGFETESTIVAAIRRCRSSVMARNRVAALQWSKVFFQWNDLTIETMMLLSREENEIVRTAANQLFEELQSKLNAESAEGEQRSVMATSISCLLRHFDGKDAALSHHFGAFKLSGLVSDAVAALFGCHLFALGGDESRLFPVPTWVLRTKIFDNARQPQIDHFDSVKALLEVGCKLATWEPLRSVQFARRYHAASLDGIASPDLELNVLAITAVGKILRSLLISEILGPSDLKIFPAVLLCRESFTPLVLQWLQMADPGVRAVLMDVLYLEILVDRENYLAGQKDGDDLAFKSALTRSLILASRELQAEIAQILHRKKTTALTSAEELKMFSKISSLTGSFGAACGVIPSLVLSIQRIEGEEVHRQFEFATQALQSLLDVAREFSQYSSLIVLHSSDEWILHNPTEFEALVMEVQKTALAGLCDVNRYLNKHLKDQDIGGMLADLLETSLGAHRKLSSKRKVARDVLNALISASSITASASTSSQGSFEKVWSVLIANVTWEEFSLERHDVQFSLAEALVRMAHFRCSEGPTKWDELLARVVKSCYHGGSSQTTIAALCLLVGVKYPPFGVDARAFLLLATELLLRLIHAKNGFVQDICCMGLGRVYEAAVEFDRAAAAGAAGATEHRPLAATVADEVIRTLTREKRMFQPAGVAVAGEQTATSETGDTGRAIERLLAAGAREERSNASPEEERDALLTAAGNLAAQIGVQPRNAVGSGNNNGDRSQAQQGNADDNEYGIYATACKVARKSGDPVVVFTVLGMIRRDPTFGAGERGDVAFEIYEHYKPKQLTIESEKLPGLLPLLFQARFDPSAGISEVMRSLWTKLVAQQNQKQLVEEMQVEIIKYLGSNLKSPAWREREAAAVALEAFLPQRKWVVIFPMAEQLWRSAFAVLDDVRESCRLAALGLMKALAEHILRECDPATCTTGKVRESVDFILPIVLDQGLVARVEGKGFSLGVLVRVVKSAQNDLGEWRPRLVGVLVECMSAFEPAMFQYMQFHTTRLNLNEEELEKVRLKLSQQSPMQEALDVILTSLDESVLGDVILQLGNHLHRGVGLATRAAAAQSLAGLAERYPNFMTTNGVRPFTAMLSALTTISHMPASLHKALISGVGALSKVVEIAALEIACHDIVEQFNSLSSDQLDMSIVLGASLNQLLRRSGDRLTNQNLWADLLSTSFLASFDAIPEAAEVWQSTWEESLIYSGSGTKLVGLQKSCDRVIAGICRLLAHLSWNRRLQGIAALNDLVGAMPFATLADRIGSVVYQLLLLLPGQIWTGQHKIFEIFPKIVQATEHFDANLPEEQVFVGQTDGGEILVELEWFRRKEEVSDSTEASQSFCSEEVCSSSHKNACEIKLWKISVKGLVGLLSIEIIRGDNLYKMAVARALSELPWQTISENDATIFIHLLPELVSLAEVSFPFDGEHPTDVTLPSPAARAILKHSPAVAQKPRNQQNFAMFGSRYGASAAPATVSRKKVKLSDVPEGAVDAAHTAPREVASSTKNISALELQELRELFAEISANSRKPREHSIEPAFRMFLLDCIREGWPRANSAVSPKDQKRLQSFGILLLWWTAENAKTEVWTIRRSCLRLIGRLACCCENRVDGVAEPLWTELSGALVLGLRESKYAKVKLAALASLEELIRFAVARKRSTGSQFNLLLKHVREMVDSLQDTQSSNALSSPEVQQEISRVRVAWSELQK